MLNPNPNANVIAGGYRTLAGDEDSVVEVTAYLLNDVSMNYYCIFTPAPLLLYQVKLNGDGSIKSGVVDNGGWYLTIKGDIFIAAHNYDRRRVVNKFTVNEYQLVKLEQSEVVRDDYNETIYRAQKRLHEARIVRLTPPSTSPTI